MPCSGNCTELEKSKPDSEKQILNMFSHMCTLHEKKRHENKRGSTREEKLYQHQWKVEQGVTGFKIDTVCGVLVGGRS
jgi:hypothetical protein